MPVVTEAEITNSNYVLADHWLQSPGPTSDHVNAAQTGESPLPDQSASRQPLNKTPMPSEAETRSPGLGERRVVDTLQMREVFPTRPLWPPRESISEQPLDFSTKGNKTEKLMENRHNRNPHLHVRLPPQNSSLVASRLYSVNGDELEDVRGPVQPPLTATPPSPPLPSMHVVIPSQQHVIQATRDDRRLGDHVISTTSETMDADSGQSNGYGANEFRIPLTNGFSTRSPVASNGFLNSGLPPAVGPGFGSIDVDSMMINPLTIGGDSSSAFSPTMFTAGLPTSLPLATLIESRKNKNMRPFKAYPRDPLSLPLGYLATHPLVAMDSVVSPNTIFFGDSAISEYHKQMMFHPRSYSHHLIPSRTIPSSSTMIPSSPASSQHHYTLSVTDHVSNSMLSPDTCKNNDNRTHVNNQNVKNDSEKLLEPSNSTKDENQNEKIEATTNHKNDEDLEDQQPPSVGISENSNSPVASPSEGTSGTPDSGGPASNKGLRRLHQRCLPDELKDEAYWERRRKNNEAAKRSRDARRAKEDEIAIRAALLEQENLKLRVEVAALKNETAKLRCLLYNS